MEPFGAGECRCGDDAAPGVREAGATAMRIVVRDANNGAAGTPDTPVEP